MDHQRANSLFARYRATGNPEDFAGLFDLTRDELINVARRLAPDRSAADDLVQATFLAALEGVGRFQDGRPVVPWLVGIMQNQAQVQRWKNRARPDADRLAWPAPQDPAAKAEAAELLLLLESAIDDLGDVYRPVLTLHLRHGLSAKEIGAAIGREAGTVRTQVVRGMSMLRKRLPASLVSLLLVQMLPARGVEGLRQALMQRAAEIAAASGVAPATSSSAAVAGRAGLVGKLVAVVAILTAGALAVFVDWGVTPVSSGGTVQPPSGASAEPVAGPLRGDSDPGQADGVAREVLAARPRFATLGVTVVDVAGGGPVSDLALHIMRQSANVSLYTFYAVTDARGQAVFERLPAGLYYLPFSARATGLHMVDLQAGESREVRARSPLGVLVRGVVVSEFGAPVAGADVWSEDLVCRVVTKTDPQGEFCLRMLRGLSIRAATETAVSNVLRVRDGDSELLRLTLTDTCQATTGQVLDDDGRAIPDAMVIVRKPTQARSARPSAAWLTASDEDGQFSFTGIPQDGMWSVEAWSPGYGRAGVHILSPSDRSGIEFVLPRAARVRGRITDQQGHGVEAIVTLKTPGPAQDRMFGCFVKCAPNGDYELTDITPGEMVELRVASRNRQDWDLTAKKPKMRIIRGHGIASRTFNLAGGADETWNAELDPGLLIHGRVVNRLGEPMTRLTVTLTTADDDHQRSQMDFTDDEGGFRFVGLAQGNYTLLFSVRGGGERLERMGGVRPRTDLYLIEFKKKSTVRGRLVLPDGSPCVGCKVWLDTFDGPDLLQVPSGETDRDGRFELREVPPGARRVRANYPEHAHLLTAEFVVQAGMTKELPDLVMHEGGRVVITGPDVGPNLLNCVLIDASGHMSMLLPSKHKGGLRSARLTPGTYRMIVQDVAAGGHVPSLGHTGFAPTVRMIEIRDGEETSFTYQTKPAVFVRIRVSELGEKPKSMSGKYIVTAPGGSVLVSYYVIRAPIGLRGVFGYDSSTLKFHESELRLGFFIGPGEYRVRVETRSGQVGTMKLSVPSLTTQIEMPTLEVR